MKKVSFQDFTDACNKWKKDRTTVGSPEFHQRLGQYLFNTLIRKGSDPEIFYEENHNTAYGKFFNKYVDINTWE